MTALADATVCAEELLRAADPREGNILAQAFRAALDFDDHGATTAPEHLRVILDGHIETDSDLNDLLEVLTHIEYIASGSRLDYDTWLETDGPSPITD